MEKLTIEQPKWPEINLIKSGAMGKDAEIIPGQFITDLGNRETCGKKTSAMRHSKPLPCF